MIEDKGYIIFTVVIFTILVAAMYGSVQLKRETAIANQYNNVDAIILSINSNEQTLSRDKFRSPQLCNTALVKLIGYENQHTVLKGCDNPTWGGIQINDRWIYNHSVGDTVHFDFIKKSRFFPITKKSN